MAELRATKRNPLLGLLADALSPVADYLSTSTNPIEDTGSDLSLTGLLGDTINPLAVTADRLSYGAPLTTGRGMTRQMRPETRDALLAVSPSGLGAKAAGRGAVATGKAISPQVEKTLMDFMRQQGGIKDIFIGPNAKTWDKAAAEKFAELEKAGVSNKEAYLQTGTFRSPDGKLRQELPDQIGLYPKNTYSYQDVAYPSAKKSYPDLLGTDLLIRSDETGGAYTPPKKGNKYEYGQSEMVEVYRKEKPDKKSTLAHETQHAIQQREGFAKGGTPSDFLEEYNSAKNDLPAYKRALVDAVNPFTGEPIDRQVIQKKIKEMENILNTDKSTWAFDKYKRLAGEAEARAVQSRLNMTPEQRRASFPLDSYDVPINELIIRGLLD